MDNSMTRTGRTIVKKGAVLQDAATGKRYTLKIDAEFRMGVGYRNETVFRPIGKSGFALSEVYFLVTAWNAERLAKL